ncbi:hypothetical protein TNCV_2773881 [Trichonephila clavipes]|nr:hypothetical protein TNCV_2773881 [Trichonephila clavipes]
MHHLSGSPPPWGISDNGIVGGASVGEARWRMAERGLTNTDCIVCFNEPGGCFEAASKAAFIPVIRARKGQHSTLPKSTIPRLFHSSNTFLKAIWVENSCYFSKARDHIDRTRQSARNSVPRKIETGAGTTNQNI